VHGGIIRPQYTQKDQIPCSFFEAFFLLQSISNFIDHLPPHKYSLDAPSHLQEVNKAMREDIYKQYIQITWISSPKDFGPKMVLYFQHFTQMRDGGILLDISIRIRNRCLASILI
jgi:hypothetical protein